MTKREYLQIHYWIRKLYGNAYYCSNDKLHKAKRYHWANISGKYKRDINDYKQLCSSCHVKMDYTEERRKKNIGNQYAIRKEIVQINRLGETVEKYSSIRQAAIRNKISRTAIINCLRSRTKTSGGYIWQYHINNS